MILSTPEYDIHEQIYESSRSLVFRANRKADQVPVILKMLKQEYPSLDQVARFQREYELTNDLEIEGVIKVYGLERFEHTWMMVEEDFGGSSLAKLLPFHVLEIPRFLKIAIRTSEILAQLHQKGIIHKDINPSNIVWNPDMDSETHVCIKIIDFGISTELPREQPEVLSPNILEGTLPYISPEQTGRMNRAIDYRSDLYSLGASLYRILTGYKPFDSQEPMELVHCHIAKLPKAPHQLAPHVPVVLSNIILKLMSKAPEDRYLSAAGLKIDLQRCLDGLQSNNKLDSFELGTHDVSDRFRIPQKLYGREAEVNRLMDAFFRVAEGPTEMMFDWRVLGDWKIRSDS